MPTDSPENKFELTINEPQELKIYFFIGRKVLDMNHFEEKIISMVAYNLETALEQGRKDYEGYVVTYNGQNTTVKSFLTKLNVDFGMFNAEPAPSMKFEFPPLTPQEVSFEQFRCNLLFVADRYVSEKDREALKQIIKNLKRSKNEAISPQQR